MINRVVLVGRLTKDVELRYTPSGVAHARFTLAVNRTYTNSQGEKEADFINITVWRKPAENSANFLKKGSLAGVEGRIQTGSYDGQDGKKVYTTEVVADSVQFLESRSATEQRAQPPPNPPTQQNTGGTYPTHTASGQNRGPNAEYIAPPPVQGYSSGPIEVSDDDLPF